MAGMIIFFMIIIFWIFRFASQGARKNTTAANKADKAKETPKAAAVRPEPASGSAMEDRMRREFPHLYEQAAMQEEISEPLHSGSLPPTIPEGSDPCHDEPAHIPSGSLGGISTEGMDPCHDDWQMMAEEEPTSEVSSTDQGGLNLNWTGSEIVKGFVYGEILQRRARQTGC